MLCEQVHCRDARSMSCWQKVRVVSAFFMQPFQYFQMVNLVDCLSSWYKFITNNPSNIKKSQQHCFDSWFGLTELFGCGKLAVFHCAFLPLRFRVVLVDPCFITCGDTAQNIILLSKRSWKIVTLLCFRSSVSSFGTIFAHTFLLSRSSVKIFLTVSLSMFTCSAMLQTVSRRFSRTIWRAFAMFSSILLLLAVLISLRQWHFPFPQKNVSTTCKLLFSS